MLKNCLTLLIVFQLVSLTAATVSREPYIGYAYPAGAGRGSTIQVIVGGMNLPNLDGALISGGGVEVKSAKFFHPFKNLSNDLRRELMPILKAIDDGKDPVAESKKNSEKIIESLKKQQKQADKKDNAKDDKTDKDKPDSKNTDGLDEMLQIVPGERLIYIDMTPEEVVKKIKSLSPIEYECLLKEVFRKKDALQAAPAIEQTAILELAISPKAKTGFRELRLITKEGVSNQIPFVISPLPETTNSIVSKFKKKQHKENTVQQLKMDTITNGQIMPGEIDKYRFKAESGKNYSFDLKGRSLVPFLSDAVPGWFQPVMSVQDRTGKILAFADDNLFSPDPVLSFTPTQSGEYELWIRDAIYRGREDFVYRLQAGSGHPEQIKVKSLKLNYQLPEISETEPNNQFEQPQKVAFPALLSGKINQPGDIDTFCFEGKKGQKIVAEVFARRLDSPLDSLVRLTDTTGKVLAWNDDYAWLNIGTQTHQADSYLSYELPADGKYLVRVADTQAKGGEGFDYKLRLDMPRPDFTIYMRPSAINSKSRVSAPITMEVFRQDGFDGQIEIMVKQGPGNLKLNGGVIPAGVNKIQMTLEVPEKIKPGSHDITLAGKAQVGGRRIVNDVIPSDEIMQAFLYTHLVPTDKGILYVSRKGWLPVKPDTPEKITLSPGEKFEFKLFDFQHSKKDKDEPVFELVSPPKGISLTQTGYKNKNYLLTISAAPDMKPWQGNIIIKCFAKGSKGKGGKAKEFTYPIGALPAIPVTVVKK